MNQLEKKNKPFNLTLDEFEKRYVGYYLMEYGQNTVQKAIRAILRDYAYADKKFVDKYLQLGEEAGLDGID